MGTGPGGAELRSARPRPPGSGSRYTWPSYSSRSPRSTLRTISITSRVRCTGWSNGTPCQPSTTCGPLTPRPRMNRPPVSERMVAAVIAIIAGVRAPTCMIPVPSPMRLVRPATNARGVTASKPHASAVQTECTPNRSASTAKAAAPAQSPAPPPASGIARRTRSGPETLGDGLDLPQVIEVVDAHEEHPLAPVERAERRVRDRHVEVLVSASLEHPRVERLAQRLERPPVVLGASEAGTSDPGHRVTDPRRRRSAGDDRADSHVAELGHLQHVREHLGGRPLTVRRPLVKPLRRHPAGGRAQRQRVPPQLVDQFGDRQLRRLCDQVAADPLCLGRVHGLYVSRPPTNWPLNPRSTAWPGLPRATYPKSLAVPTLPAIVCESIQPDWKKPSGSATGAPE